MPDSWTITRRPIRLLLDTHIWIWSVLDPDKLSARVAEALRSKESELWLWPIRTWEALVLVERGRVVVDGDPWQWVATALRAGPFRQAPVTHAVAMEGQRVRLEHGDPADRFLAATARVFALTLLTADWRLWRSRAFKLLRNC